MKDLTKHINEKLSAFSGKEVIIQNKKEIHGGDINQTFILETNIGHFFLKVNNTSLHDMFEKEFNGLNLLHAVQSLKVPAPLLHGRLDNRIFLVMEFFGAGRYLREFLAAICLWPLPPS